MSSSANEDDPLTARHSARLLVAPHRYRLVTGRQRILVFGSGWPSPLRLDITQKRTSMNMIASNPALPTIAPPPSSPVTRAYTPALAYPMQIAGG
jgi:hypothetical protein